jgi:hypothetical protein
MEEIKIIYSTYEDIILINYFNNSVIKKNINKGTFKIDDESIIITWNEKIDLEEHFLKNKINLINKDVYNINQIDEYIYIETKNISKNNLIIKLHSLNNIFEIILYKDKFKLYENNIISDNFSGTYILDRNKIIIKWDKDELINQKKKNNFFIINKDEIYIKNENNEFYITDDIIIEDIKSENIKLELYLVHKDWEELCYANNVFITKSNESSPYILNDNLLIVNWEKYDKEEFLLNKVDNKYYLKSITIKEIYLVYTEKNINNSIILKNNTFLLNTIDKNIYDKKNKVTGNFNIIDNILVINWNNDNIDNFNLNEENQNNLYYSEYLLNNLFEKIYIKNDNINYNIYLLNKNESKLFYYNKNNILLFDYFRSDDNIIMTYFLYEIEIINNKILIDNNYKFILNESEKINNKNIENTEKYLYKIYKFNNSEKYYIDTSNYYLEEINIIHKDWNDICIINKYFKILYRKSELTEYGNYKIFENNLIIYWNKWSEEVFINNNGIYHYDNYLTNNMDMALKSKNNSKSFSENNYSNLLESSIHSILQLDSETFEKNTSNFVESFVENNTLELIINNNNIIQNSISDKISIKSSSNQFINLKEDETINLHNVVEVKNERMIPLNLSNGNIIIETPNKKILIYHNDWNEECTIENNYLYRKNKDEFGKYLYRNNTLIIYWEKWDKDLFFLIDNNFYSEKFIKYMIFNQKKYIINIFLNKIYEEINENFIFKGCFNYIFEKISILWDSEAINKEYYYDSDIFYLDIEECNNKTYSFKFDIIILKEENQLNENIDDNSSDSDISYCDINFNEIIEYNEELNQLYVKDYENNYLKNKNDSSNIYSINKTRSLSASDFSNSCIKNNNIKSEFYEYLLQNSTIDNLNKIINELDICLIYNDIITILVFYAIIFFIKKH